MLTFLKLQGQSSASAVYNSSSELLPYNGFLGICYSASTAGAKAKPYDNFIEKQPEAVLKLCKPLLCPGSGDQEKVHWQEDGW